MKRFLIVLSLFLLLTVPAYAVCTEEEITAGTCTEEVTTSTDEVALLQEIKIIEQDNQQLLMQQTAMVEWIMYILVMLTAIIYIIFFIRILRMLCKFFGFGLV